MELVELIMAKIIELKCKCGLSEMNPEAYNALPTQKCDVCGEQKQARAKLSNEKPWEK
jgi:hypothetical protein